jgi:hypothetical protein
MMKPIWPNDKLAAEMLSDARIVRGGLARGQSKIRWRTSRTIGESRSRNW